MSNILSLFDLENEGGRSLCGQQPADQSRRRCLLICCCDCVLLLLWHAQLGTVQGPSRCPRADTDVCGRQLRDSGNASCDAHEADRYQPTRRMHGRLPRMQAQTDAVHRSHMLIAVSEYPVLSLKVGLNRAKEHSHRSIAAIGMLM